MKNLSKNKRSKPNLLKYLLHRDALKRILVGILEILNQKKKIFTQQPKNSPNPHTAIGLLLFKIM